MELLTANLGKARREVLNGREYLVAPLSLLVPGVLNGSQGPLYYPPDEVAKNHDAWNGMPIVLWHPTLDGVPVSARRPDVLNEYQLGWVYNATADGRLTAEGWFDVEMVRKVDNAKLTPGDRVLPKLLAGKPIELSTGLFTTNYPARPDATHNGRHYAYVARDYRPDHLAVLPDQVGACSLADGCGVNVTPLANAAGGSGGGMGAAVAKAVGGGVEQLTSEALEDGMHHHFLADDPEAAARKAAEYLADSGTVEVSGEAGIWTVTLEEPAGGNETEEHMFHFLPSRAANNGGAAAAANVLERMWQSVVNAVLGQPQSKNTGRFKPLGAGTGRGDVHEAAQRGSLVLTEDDLRLGAVAGRQKRDEGHNPASWVEDEALWEKAKAAADKGDYEKDSDQYWAVVTAIYKKMGGGVKEDKSANNTESGQQPPMESGDMSKTQKVQLLATNCECWKGKESVLNGMTDDDLDRFVVAYRVVNSVKERFGKAFKEQTGSELTANLMPAFVTNALGVRNAGDMTKCPECGKMTMNKKTGTCTNCGYEAGKGEMEMNAKEDPEDALDGGADESEETPSGKKKPMTKNGATLNADAVKEHVKAYLSGLTEEQWLASAPAGVRASIANAAEIEKEHRHRLVGEILTNAGVTDDAARKTRAEQLLKKSIPELKEIRSLQPERAATANAGKAGGDSEVDEFIRNYYGAQGAAQPTGNADGLGLTEEEATANPLPRPTMNYEDISYIGENRRRRAAREAAAAE